VWEILHDAGINPAPERNSQTWAAFLRSQAEAILAADFLETVTDRQHLAEVFGMSEPTALRYADAARQRLHPGVELHPRFTANSRTRDSVNACRPVI
jgi:hypothetical protein